MYEVNLHKLSEEFSAKLLLEEMSISHAAEAVDILDSRLLQKLNDGEEIHDLRLDTFLAICNWLQIHPASFIKTPASITEDVIKTDLLTTPIEDFNIGDVVKIDFIDDSETILSQQWTVRIHAISIDDEGDTKYHIDCKDIWFFIYSYDRDGNKSICSDGKQMSDIDTVISSFVYHDTENWIASLFVDPCRLEEDPFHHAKVKISKI